MLYQTFIKRLLINYILGSMAAVVGVGGVFLFTTLDISHHDQFWMFIILIGSMCVMFLCESLMFLSHIKPIRKVFLQNDSPVEDLSAALWQAQRFPTLTIKRILGPHFLGLSIPAIIAAYSLIQLQLLHIDKVLILYAFIAAFLIASMHALIEFYLTLSVIQPILAHLRVRLLKQSDTLLSGNELLVSIRRKFQYTILLIGIFPVLVFMLASLVKFTEWTGVETKTYWQWAITILTTTVIYAVLISRFMYRDIEKPINQLLDKMNSIQHNDYQFLRDNVYTDEFSQLISGFNHMIKGIKTREENTNQLLQSFISVLTKALDARDPYTAGHSSRVAEFSLEIAKRRGLSEIEQDRLFRSATLHDIGKMGVPDYVLLKDGKLTDEEFGFIKAHPVIGENILMQISPQEQIIDLLPGVRSHHERMDGRGYPDGLVGEAIPLYGRIIAVADAFDAMTSDRPYRKGMPIEKAVSILMDGKGTQWDAGMVDAFLHYLKDRKIID